MENLQLLTVLLMFISAFFFGTAFGLCIATLLDIKRSVKESTKAAGVDNFAPLPTFPGEPTVSGAGPREVIAVPKDFFQNYQTPQKPKKKPTQSVVMKYRKPQEIRAEKEAAIEESFLEDLKKEERESGTFAL